MHTADQRMSGTRPLCARPRELQGLVQAIAQKQEKTRTHVPHGKQPLVEEEQDSEEEEDDPEGREAHPDLWRGAREERPPRQVGRLEERLTGESVLARDVTNKHAARDTFAVCN